MRAYKRRFYRGRHQRSSYSAKTILSMVIDVLPAMDSAVDVGCGVGTWLSVLKENGVGDIQGIDGSWVKRDLLEIPEQYFRQADLNKPIDLGRKYDLAVSLEVAEHLPPETARTFVDSLVSMSDFVLFSAAIPLQGGTGHVNEQWPDYWANLFGERGYVALDFIRRRVWNDSKIMSWYRQNVLMYVKRERMQDLTMPGSDLCNEPLPMALVHPEAYLSKVRLMYSVRGSCKILRRAIKRWGKSLLSKS